MTEIWEESFSKNHMMWGEEPADSALFAADYFHERNLKHILIPGFGYGRNGWPFINKDMHVTGIEISKTAIDIAKKSGMEVNIHHGSVTDMPFDEQTYDGIFSFALLHLLSEKDRKDFIAACYEQLNENGYMIFTTISKEAPMYGKGREISANYYEMEAGLTLYFYDLDSIKEDFSRYGLVEVKAIVEPHKQQLHKPPFPYSLIICRKR